MNAEEIRQFASLSRGTSEECTVILLGEIAAQLAQLNDNVFAITERRILVQVEPGQYPIRTEDSYGN